MTIDCGGAAVMYYIDMTSTVCAIRRGAFVVSFSVYSITGVPF